MPSTYSPNLRIELIATGEQAGTWGATTNTNLGTLIEDAISGYVSVSITSANQALTALNGTADQSRNMVVNLTTTTTANFNVYIPPADKLYVIRNASAYSATIFCSSVLGNTTAAGTGVTVPAGREMLVFSDGTNVAAAVDYAPSLTLGTDLAIADGGTGASDAPTARTNLGATTVGSNMFTLANPSAVTFPRFNADNTVTALDAASFRSAIGAGTGSGTVTSVAVSGGTTGLTTSGGPVTGSGTITLAGTLAVANGGTGGTTQATARSGIGTVSDPGSNGIAARTSANTLTARTITAGTGISVTNGDGVSGNPTVTNSGVTSIVAGTGITISGGTGAVTVNASGGGGFSNMQVFTTSGTFTVPAGITKVKATVVGGGGGGLGTWNDGDFQPPGAGGGGGGTAVEIVSGLTPGGTVAVTVGGGGAAGSAGGAGSVGSNGGTGGTSSFGAFCSATGGAGATNNTIGGQIYTFPGLGGAGSGGDLNITGSPGGPGVGVGGTGGSSFLGGGGRTGLFNTGTGSAGGAYGGGGGGASAETTGARRAGGAGAAGVVIVEW